MRSCVTKLPVLAILASTGSIPRNTDECLTDGSIASTCRIRVPCILWNYYNNCHLPVVLVLMYVHAEYTRQTATFLVCQLLLQSDNCEIVSFLLVVLSRICCCLHIKPFFLPSDISSTPSVLPDSSSERDTNSVVTDGETEKKQTSLKNRGTQIKCKRIGYERTTKKRHPTNKSYEKEILNE